MSENKDPNDDPRVRFRMFCMQSREKCGRALLEDLSQAGKGMKNFGPCDRCGRFWNLQKEEETSYHYCRECAQQRRNLK